MRSVISRSRVRREGGWARNICESIKKKLFTNESDPFKRIVKVIKSSTAKNGYNDDKTDRLYRFPAECACRNEKRSRRREMKLFVLRKRTRQ